MQNLSHRSSIIGFLRNRSGYGLVETIVALAVFLMLTSTGITTVLHSLSANQLGEEETHALLIAQEGLEGVRSIKNQGWNSPFLSTECAVGCGIDSANGKWIFSGQNNINGKYTRTIRIENVFRDGSGTIQPTGDPDPYTKRVESRVSWNVTGARNNEVKLVTYVTFWDKPISTSSCDLSDASVQGTFNFAGNNYAKKLQAQGNYLYVVLNDPGDAVFDFAILNVTDPKSPQQVATMNIAGNPTDIAVLGRYAFVTSTDDNQELQVIDFGDPNNPSPNPTKTFLNLSGTLDAHGVFVVGTTVYVVKEGGTGSNREFFIINATNAMAPSLQNVVDLGGNNQGGRDVWVSGNFAYIAGNHNTQEIKVVNLTTLSVVGSYDIVPGNNIANTVTGNGTYLFAGASNNSISVLDIANPPSLPLATTYSTLSSVNDISIDPSSTLLAYGANSNAGNELEILNITNPESPTLISGIKTEASTYGVTWDSTRCALYAAIGPNALGEEILVIMPGATVPTPTPTPTPTPDTGATSTPTPTNTPVPVATNTPTPTVTPTPTTSINSCVTYCHQLGYSSASCQQRTQLCTNIGGTYQSGGDLYCPAPGDASNQKLCCCTP